MKIERNLKSGRIALIGILICVSALLIATIAMPGRSGRLLSPIAWIGAILNGLACLYSRTLWHKAAGAACITLVLAASLLTERVGEILLYLVASGAWLYEGLGMLVITVILLHFIPDEKID